MRTEDYVAAGVLSIPLVASILLLVLRMSGMGISWLWVTAPIWIPVALSLILAAALFIRIGWYNHTHPRNK